MKCLHGADSWRPREGKAGAKAAGLHQGARGRSPHLEKTLKRVEVSRYLFNMNITLQIPSPRVRELTQILLIGRTNSNFTKQGPFLMITYFISDREPNEEEEEEEQDEECTCARCPAMPTREEQICCQKLKKWQREYNTEGTLSVLNILDHLLSCRFNQLHIRPSQFQKCLQSWCSRVGWVCNNFTLELAIIYYPGSWDRHMVRFSEMMTEQTGRQANQQSAP